MKSQGRFCSAGANLAGSHRGQQFSTIAAHWTPTVPASLRGSDGWSAKSLPRLVLNDTLCCSVRIVSRTPRTSISRSTASPLAAMPSRLRSPQCLGPGGRCDVTGIRSSPGGAPHPQSARWRPHLCEAGPNALSPPPTQRRRYPHHRGNTSKHLGRISSGSRFPTRPIKRLPLPLQSHRLHHFRNRRTQALAFMLLDAADPARTRCNASPRAASPRAPHRAGAWAASMSCRGEPIYTQSASKYRSPFGRQPTSFPPICCTFRRGALTGCPRTSARAKSFPAQINSVHPHKLYAAWPRRKRGYNYLPFCLNLRRRLWADHSVRVRALVNARA